MHNLFTSPSGEPLSTPYTEFFLCGLHPSVSTAVRSHGGVVVSLNSHDSIHLIPNAPKSVTAERFIRQVYSASFVNECIEAGEVLDLSDFIVYADVPPNGKSRRRVKLRQIDINQLVRYVSRHPQQEDESTEQYWDRVGNAMEFRCSSAVLQKEYTRHLRKLPAQGFYLQAVRRVPRISTEPSPTDFKLPISVRLFVPFQKPTCPPECVIPAAAAPPLYQTEGSLIVARFEALVHTCQRLCQASVTATEVLRALIRCRGNSKLTIQAFKETH